MKRLFAAALVVAAALAVAGVVLAATTRTISASATKLAYSKKALVAKPGKVTLRMTNPSILMHNIALRKGPTAKSKLLIKGKIVGKGGVSKVTATLKAGKYRYLCTVRGHEAGGMWGILTVKR
jgi:plastocyanin